jgi:gamma-glutamylcyclotransferase (GGCT)/AIG2-like uncharacterized protein YtfP
VAKTAIFVYGTLKRGFASHSLLASQEFVGAAQTLPYYRLWDNGSHPCLVENREHGLAVQGEIWRVEESLLAKLDEYEDVPHTFIRGVIALDGYSGPVFAYFYRGDVSALHDCGSCWSGPSSSAQNRGEPASS